MDDKAKKNPVLPQGFESATRKVTVEQVLRDEIGEVPRFEGCNENPLTCERKREGLMPRCRKCMRV